MFTWSWKAHVVSVLLYVDCSTDDMYDLIRLIPHMLHIVGSCASSTVTMQMGIEHVLKESFPDLGEVLQVEDPNAEAGPAELTWEAVEAEVNRIKPAIIAMGGVVKIKSVEPIGVVELEFRGSNKLQQGLELAIRDVPFVKHVKFTM